MSLKEKLNSKTLTTIFIFFFSLFFNQYFGNRGIFPIDSFSHFDLGFRVLNGELPFKDYWVVSGPFVDFIQAFIFLILGVNWQTYLLNASILNGIFAVLTYKLFLEFKLDKKFSFFYTICLAILAYPSSGTPFVDHHSTYFSVISLYLLIFAIKTEKLSYWFFLPIFVGFAFLSKQVPATYVGFSIILLIAYDSIFNNRAKNFNIFFTLIISTSIFFLLFFLFLYFNEISFQSFLDQYINYPREIGRDRFLRLNYDYKNAILNFKFIHIVFILLIFLNISKFLNNKKFYKTINFKIFLILLLLLLSLMQHQILTRNQIFIFFLIPLFCGFTHIELHNLNHKYKDYLIYFLILVCLTATFKYHLRFNLEKKFHEFNNVNFNNSINGKILDKKFKSLNWITPGTKEKKEAIEEIKFLKEILEILKADKEKKMLFTNYSFFSVLSGESVNSITRWFPGDDSAFPVKGNKFYDTYRNFLLKQIKSKEIINIYLISDVYENYLLDYLPLECLKKTKIHKHLSKFKINDKCQDLYGN